MPREGAPSRGVSLPDERNPPGAVDSGHMTATYLELRRSHFLFTLKTWFRGLDKALIAAASVLTFLLTAIVTMLVYGLAQALELLTNPAVDLPTRGAVVAGWQLVSFVLLRSLREAAFMPRARPLFDTLPIALADRLRADLVLSILGYSFLWLPVAWAIFDPLDTRTGPALASLAILLELVLVSLCLNIILLRGGQGASVAAGALAAFALLGRSGLAWDAARFGCALLAAVALWSSYLPRPAPAARRVRRGTAGERLALASGLVLPLLGNELKANLLLRIGCIAATLSACLLVMTLRTNDTSGASVVVFVAATATLALYSLPALSRITLLTRLGFLAGQPRFARRMRVTAYGIPVALFAASLAIASAFDRSARPQIDALVFAVLFILGVIGARLGWRATSWMLPFLTMIALVILGAMT